MDILRNALEIGSDFCQSQVVSREQANGIALQQSLYQAGSADSAMVLTLPPGAYTVEVSGADGGSGVALVEIYEVP